MLTYDSGGCPSTWIASWNAASTLTSLQSRFFAQSQTSSNSQDIGNSFATRCPPGLSARYLGCLSPAPPTLTCICQRHENFAGYLSIQTAAIIIVVKHEEPQSCFRFLRTTWNGPNDVLQGVVFTHVGITARSRGILRSTAGELRLTVSTIAVASM
jgi:hypothetical protein